MKQSRLKINNSYESEPSSSSASNELIIDEERSLDESIQNLPDLFKPQFYRIEQLISNVNKDNKSATKNLSQEFDFKGFSDSEINESKGSNDLKTSNCIDYITYESETNKVLKGKRYEDNLQPNPNEIVKEIIGYNNQDNSCNAVDMKLSNENPKKSGDDNKNLTFNGKIKNICAVNSNNINTMTSCKNFDTSKFMYANERSPDMFEDDDDENDGQTNANSVIVEEQDNNTSYLDQKVNEIMKKERELLRKIQDSLSGLPPPPSVTITQLDMQKEIANNKHNILNFKYTLNNVKNDEYKDILLKPTHSFEEMKNTEWPDILNVKHHGLCYNLSKVSEQIELLSMSVVERYIGVETSSSFIKYLSTSSPKKRNIRLKMLCQSPGNRLSHLAKRRAIFSSANLQLTSRNSGTTKSSNRQILLDTRKSKIVTPKRRTPGRRKSIVRNTPTSSAKKRLLYRVEVPKAGPSRETSKRALFQSPPKQKPISINVPKIKPEIANRVEKSKRALFSPCKSQTSNCSQDRMTSLDFKISQPFSRDSICIKRKRDDDILGNMSKISRNDLICSSNVDNLTPRSMKFKSQSFCVGGASQTPSNIISGKSLFRASSDSTCYSSHLTDSHKKKLLWAVSQALQNKQVGVTHPNFKQYASVLARVVKRLFMESPQKAGSTSEKMLRLAKKYVFSVIRGKTADDIYLLEKARIDYEKQTSKITGYIAADEYEDRKNNARKSTSSLFLSENSFDSFSLSQLGFSQLSQSGINSQSSEFFCQISQDDQIKIKNDLNNAIKLPIQTNKSLQNSSSKNNLNGIALRENIDCEQRRSAQKNFTGKDQKNVSPYTEKSRSALKKHSSMIYSDINTAKRQISFDY